MGKSNNINSNSQQAKEDKKKVKRKLKGKKHNTNNMYGVIVTHPVILRAEYYAPSKERQLKIVSKIKDKALNASVLHELKYKLISKRK